MKDLAPVIIGVGEAFDERPADLAAALSPVALAAGAAERAIADAGGDAVRRAIDAVAMTRTYPDSTPFWPHPATPIGNAPGGLAARVAVKAKTLVYEIVGGQTPQALVNEFAARLAAGEFSAVLIAGGDAIATEKAARRASLTLDWTEKTDGDFDARIEDRGPKVDGLLSLHEIANGLVEVAPVYALFEQARRAKLNLSREVYARAMGDLLAPFAAVAAEKEGAATKRALSAEEVASASETNPMLYDPFTKAVMAKDGVNMGAALVMTTAGRARELGVADEKIVYLHGAAETSEQPIMDRPDLAESPAMRAAYAAALEQAGVSPADVSLFDFYSCFPIAVFIAREAMGVIDGDLRPMTVTGGLPFFGGPGNNYSMHAIAEMTRRLRRARHSYGAVGANGGFLSKHATGVYSAKQPTRQFAAAAKPEAAPPPARWAAAPQGEGVIETYTIAWKDGAPSKAFACGRLSATGERFLARTSKDDRATPESMSDADPLGRRVAIEPAENGAVFNLEGEG